MDIEFLKAPLQVYLVKTMITGKGSYRSIVGRRKQGSNERRRRRQKEFLERETELQEKEEEEVGGMEGLRRKSRWFHHQQCSLSFTIQNWTAGRNASCSMNFVPILTCPQSSSRHTLPLSPQYTYYVVPLWLADMKLLRVALNRTLYESRDAIILPVAPRI